MELLIALLSKAYNLDAERIADILYKKADDGKPTEELREEALNELLELDKNRISTLKGDTKKTFDNGYQKAQKEVAEKWEKMLRDKSGLASESVGEQLLSEVFEALEAKKGKKADDDSIKTHPLYLELERKYLADIETAKKEGATALEQFKAEYSAKELKSAVKNKAREILMAKKPVLEDDATIAQVRIEDFLREFDQYDYQADNDGYLPIKDGKRLENDHSHPIGFGDLVEQIANRRFKFQVQDPKGSAGNKNDPAGGGSSGQFNKPTSDQEAWETFNKVKNDPDARKKLLETLS